MEAHIHALKDELGEGLDYTALESLLEGDFDEDEWDRVMGEIIAQAADQVRGRIGRDDNADDCRKRIGRRGMISAMPSMTRWMVKMADTMPMRTIWTSLPTSR